MIQIVSWNIAKRKKPWHVLEQMANEGKVDVALLQEAGNPPTISLDCFQYDNQAWDKEFYDRWPLVVKLSDRVDIEWFQLVPPLGRYHKKGTVGASDGGTIAVAKVTPRNHSQESFIVASMYARWLMPHLGTYTRWQVGEADSSAHRIISDLSAFIGHEDPSTHRIVAAGDLNMIWDKAMVGRERTVWMRMEALGDGISWATTSKWASCRGDTLLLVTRYKECSDILYHI